jgi:hypothetical protein
MVRVIKKIRGIPVIPLIVALFFVSFISFLVRFNVVEATVEAETVKVFLPMQTSAPTREPVEAETVKVFLPKQTSAPTPALIETKKSGNRKIKTIDGLDYPAHTYSADKKYITFNWNSGRLNNQIRALEASIAYAKFYQRSLVIPKPRRVNEVTGIYYGLWDLHWLITKVDFLLEPDMPKKLVKLLGNPLQYTNFKDLPKDGQAFNPEEEC